MEKQSKAEQTFRERFPHARITEEPSNIQGVKRVTVYAGDYLCAEGIGRARAFSQALDYVEEGYITPDPDEQAGDFPEQS